MERIIEKVESSIPQQPRLTRVAAYARVSSGKDAMLHSLSAQVSFYSSLIQSHSGWQYCGVYADEALTGTKENRNNFQALLAECRAGNIDLIITKSISRFARNTVTLLQTVRELKLFGVDVYFEEQNIHTLSADGELMMTILASYAQEESLSVSENQKWRIRKNFEAGLPWSGTMLGYRHKDGTFAVVPEEAEIVKSIFADYLSGLGYNAIAKKLNEQGVLTRRGAAWRASAVAKMLHNEAYTGTLLLQKTYSENHLTKRRMKNEGQLPMYRVEDSHEAIIPKSVFDAVQAEADRRCAKHNPKAKKTVGHYSFTGLLECECCGQNYRRKVTTGGVVWVCGTYNSLGKKYCQSKQIPKPTLTAVTCSVLGITECTETALNKLLDGILVQNGNRLVFRMKDGTERTAEWKDRSRAESWTPEMKKQAGEKTKRRYQKCQEQ